MPMQLKLMSILILYLLFKNFNNFNEGLPRVVLKHVNIDADFPSRVSVAQTKNKKKNPKNVPMNIGIKIFSASLFSIAEKDEKKTKLMAIKRTGDC